MPFLLKLLIANGVILASVLLGRKIPSLAGLLATMPLVSLVVLVWLYGDVRGDSAVMAAFTRGAAWGILPSLLFFIAAFLGFHWKLPLLPVLGASFAVWFLGAMIHQALLR